jgi:hypothetical protein
MWNKHRVLMAVVLVTTMNASTCTMAVEDSAERGIFDSIHLEVPPWQPLGTLSSFLGVERHARDRTMADPAWGELIEGVVRPMDSVDTSPDAAPEADVESLRCTDVGIAIVTIDVTGSFSGLYEGNVQV